MDSLKCNSRGPAYDVEIGFKSNSTRLKISLQGDENPCKNLRGFFECLTYAALSIMVWPLVIYEVLTNPEAFNPYVLPDRPA